jgi:hypothetical protein
VPLLQPPTVSSSFATCVYEELQPCRRAGGRRACGRWRQGTYLGLRGRGQGGHGLRVLSGEDAGDLVHPPYIPGPGDYCLQGYDD